MTRSTSNTNVRGSAETRRRRKRWLLSPEAGWGGNGATVPCATADCDTVLTFETVTVDRIVEGIHGGRYVRENIRPKCGPCNYGEGGRLGAARAKANARKCAGLVSLPGLEAVSA